VTKVTQKRGKQSYNKVGRRMEKAAKVGVNRILRGDLEEKSHSVTFALTFHPLSRITFALLLS
jgi:hypothetical protein